MICLLSDKLQPGYRLVCLGLMDTQTFHEPTEFLRIEFPHLLLCPGPLVLSLFQSLIKEYESVHIPIQRLEPIRSPSTEKEDAIGTRVKSKLALYDGCQAVNAASQVRIAAGDVDVVDFAHVEHITSPLQESA